MLRFSFLGSKMHRKLLYSFLVVLILPTALISTSSYFISVHLLEDKVSDSFTQNLLYVGSNIEQHLNEWEAVTDYMYVNHTIRSIVRKNYESDLEFFNDMLKADQEMNDYRLGFNNKIHTDLSALIIMGDNGRTLLQGLNAPYIEIDKLKERSWYNEVQELQGKIYWIGVDAKPAINKHLTAYGISLARTINIDNRQRAVIYLIFDGKNLDQMLEKAITDHGSELQVVDRNNRIIYSSSNGNRGNFYNDVAQLDHYKNAPKKYYIAKENGQKMLIAPHYLSKFGWWVIEKTSYDDLIKDNRLIFYTTAVTFVISFIISAILWSMVTHSIVKPIRRLSHTMRNINDLDSRPNMSIAVKSSDEIGVLNLSFDQMMVRMNELFKEVLLEQEMKKDAEYKALQAQINPHFLYNTLNTIRWMAIIQKADNIKEAVEVLGRLIRNSFKQTNSLVTLREELSSIRDYVYIQQIRYGDRFRVEFEYNEADLDAMCIKFIVQPLIENAIFHGIDPKSDHCLIKVSVEIVDLNCQIEVWDNGIGMSEQQIQEALTPAEGKGIGLLNVHERLQHVYGRQYGIAIDSRAGEFTSVKLRFIYRPEEVRHVQSDDRR